MLAQHGRASLRSSKYVSVDWQAAIQCFVWLAIPFFCQPVKADYSSIAQNVLALAKYTHALYFTKIASYKHSSEAGCILMYALVTCYNCYVMYLQVKPGSSQVSSATPSDVEAGDKPKLQHPTSMVSRKRAPSQVGRDPQRSKDSNASHYLLDTDVIDGELRQCLKVNIGLLKSKAIKPEEVIQLLYNSMCRCIADALDEQLDSIKDQVVVHCKRKLGPFRSVSEIDAIESSPSAFAIMDELGILDRWLNTTLLRFFITLSRPGSAQQRIADYWLQQYTEVLQDFCSEFLVRNLSDLPDEHQDQLRRGDLDNQGHQRMLCVVYEHEFTTFTLADLLKKIDFLEEILQIPPDVITNLQTLPGNSVAVYWLFDMSYAALIFFNVHQLFWALLEHRVLSLKLKDVMTVSLRGSHVPYLIRNALQSGQNLIRQTEVCSTQLCYICMTYSHYPWSHGLKQFVLTCAIYFV